MKNENLNQDIINHAGEAGRFEERIETFERELEQDLANYRQNRIQFNASLSNLKRVHKCEGGEMCEMLGCETKPERLSIAEMNAAPYLKPSSDRKPERFGSVRV